MEEQHDDPRALKRTLGLLAITAFGVGDILGSGVYALVGKIAGLVGNGAWASYVVAGVVAALTGLTYAEFASRYPKAGGAAHFCQEAFRLPVITFFVMFFVALSGLFSMATASRTFANYATALIPGLHDSIAGYVAPLIFILVISFVAIRGVMFSSAANVVCTVVEVTGLLLIIGLGWKFLGKVDYTNFNTTATGVPIGLILQGSALAFFAFVGFEDMVNLSEEVKHPERNVPLAICFAIMITSTIYCLIGLVAVSVLPPPQLGSSNAALIDVVRAASPGFPMPVYSVIPAFAVFNMALLNLMMAARLMYGMARGRNNLLPSVLAYIHPDWRTPVVSVVLAALVTLAMMLSTLEITVLASGTTLFLLLVFALLHIGLIRIKMRSPERPHFTIPIFVPFLGAASCLALLMKQQERAIMNALYLSAVAAVLFAINWFFRGRHEVEAVD